MMESADLGQRTAAALLGWLNGARLGRILLEHEMGARAVVVAEVAAQTTTEVSLIEDNHVVEQFVSDGANDSLGERILPGRAWRSENLGQAHALHSSPELATIDAVAIAQEVAWRRVIGERLDDSSHGRRPAVTTPTRLERDPILSCQRSVPVQSNGASRVGTARWHPAAMPTSLTRLRA